ncbi:MAG: cation transporter [Proteobacteria bacterium]|nr:cation transporter [Pseudomonadota bacterium]
MADSCCETLLEVGCLRRRQRRVLAGVLAVNAAMFGVMVAGSALSGSSALLSGALDNLGDALTYAFSFAVVGASARAQARVALFKSVLIAGAALGVALQIAWRLSDLDAPALPAMSAAAALNLAANAVCLWALTPWRHADVNMSSSWECSRNDVLEGVAVLGAAGLVWATESGWPDILAAAALLVVFARSAARVFDSALRVYRTARAPV